MIAHCLFEQSGTFKNEFKKLGIDAFDYDIQNEYGETDYQVDLFAEIVGGYDDKPSIFDNISQDDLVLAFFPCTRFECQVELYFRGKSFGQDKWSEIDKIEYARNLHEELSEYYSVLCKLFLVCLKRKIKLVVENPLTQPHYLTRYFRIEPELKDMDRTKNGDYMKKPTQFWFVNFKPSNNIIFEPMEETKKYTWVSINALDREKSQQTNRSTIHPQYANRFIKQFIL